MSPRPVLRVRTPRGQARAVVLVLHGGREHSEARVRPTQLAVLRMLPIARALRRAGGRRGLAVARLRFTVRGWNDELASPVADARWALDRLAERFPGVPVALVGHSMGGRTALRVAGHESVHTVVGLAPWIEASDPREQLTGRRVLLLHGSADRITDPRRSQRLVAELAGIAASASYVSVTGDAHAMLRRPGVWNALTVGFTLSGVGITAVDGTSSDETANVLESALAGRPALVV